ncbi:MAG TPA: dual specificity protein phosphatase 23 [Gemmataceae bacterium]|jgi:atypical dual specificity phosphatase|nr:dual specificity protein phosphatase 23 [Gemmataceae bacterium]
MSRPYFFSWIDEPLLAASAEPGTPEQLAWLRGNGVDILVTLTEEPLPRTWVDGAGLLSVHVPVPDMDVPTTEQIDQVMSVIDKAKAGGMGVAVHCLAGKGRTGTILAAYFVHKGLSAREAIKKVRELRPGSIEVTEQEDAIRAYERGRRAKE